MDEERFEIPKVETNLEKGYTYKENMERYKKALSSGFYLECLWILYAMLEDRTSAFLYHIGFTSNRNRLKATGSRKVKQDIRKILALSPKAKFQFNRIQSKLNNVNVILDWCRQEHDDMSDYQQTLSTILRPLADCEELSESLRYLSSEWREKRNQLTHALFVKRTDAVNDELYQMICKGYDAVRLLDAKIKQLERRNIRKKFNIQ